MLGGAAVGQDTRGYLGVGCSQDLTKVEADKLGWDAPHGAKVSRIEPGSPAEQVKLKIGDILLLLDRMAIDNAADFNASLANRRPGAEVRLRALFGRP